MSLLLWTKTGKTQLHKNLRTSCEGFVLSFNHVGPRKELRCRELATITFICYEQASDSLGGAACSRDHRPLVENDSVQNWEGRRMVDIVPVDLTAYKKSIF